MANTPAIGQCGGHLARAAVKTPPPQFQQCRRLLSVAAFPATERYRLVSSFPFKKNPLDSAKPFRGFFAEMATIRRCSLNWKQQNQRCHESCKISIHLVAFRVPRHGELSQSRSPPFLAGHLLL